MKKGSVSLVGAGPGDPGLLTLRALQRIREADLIVYDTLANPEHLAHAKAGIKKICVGRGFRHKKWSQENINRLILSAARRGDSVVRLKGGDPYLFGRGGEEALFLVKHRIPFEVVPGVTSANGCAAYAGIPLTHRDHNAAVTFLTGHRAHDEKLDSIDWKTIVSLRGTLVIYMGFYNLKKIAAKLVRHGMPDKTPVAVIEWGTLPRQKSCDGTLKNIAALVRKKNLKVPCLIIVGDVVRFRKKLNWFEALPLFGKKVLVTRMREKAGVLSEKFRALGAEVVEFPVIAIEKITRTDDMDQAVRQLNDYDWLVFTSAYGVDSFFERLNRNKKDARALGGSKIASVGSETSASLRTRGVEPDLEPRDFETRALLLAFKSRGSLRGKRLLLLRTNIATHELEDGLKRLGAAVHRVTAYRTVRAKITGKSLKKLLQNPPDIVTFTSASTVSHFIGSVGLANAKRLARRCVFASIGPVTSGTLKKNRLSVGCQAKIYNTDGLVQAVLARAGRRS